MPFTVDDLNCDDLVTRDKVLKVQNQNRKHLPDRNRNLKRIIVPLDEAYSFDFEQTNGKNGIIDTNQDTIDTNQDTIPDDIDLKTKLLLHIEQDAKRTQKEYAVKLNVSVPTVKRLFAKLQKEEVLVREGTNRKGQWRVIEKNKVV